MVENLNREIYNKPSHTPRLNTRTGLFSPTGQDDLRWQFAWSQPDSLVLCWAFLHVWNPLQEDKVSGSAHMPGPFSTWPLILHQSDQITLTVARGFPAWGWDMWRCRLRVHAASLPPGSTGQSKSGVALTPRTEKGGENHREPLATATVCTARDQDTRGGWQCLKL